MYAGGSAPWWPRGVGWAGGRGYKKAWVSEHVQQNPALPTHVFHSGNELCTVKQRYHHQKFKRERPMNQKKKKKNSTANNLGLKI